HQRLPAGGSHLRDDPRRTEQRQLAAALLHLPGRLQLLGFRLRGGNHHRAARHPRRDRIPQVRLPRPPDPLPVTNQPFAAVDSQRVEPDAPLARPAARVPPAATPALLGHWLETAGAWLLGLLWLLPLV